MIVTCNYCQTNFEKSESEVKRNSFNNHYCSRDCFLKKKTKKKPVRCYVCNIEYIPINRQSKLSVRNYCPQCRETVTLICPVCNNSFRQHKARIRIRKNLCCSVKCKAILQRKDWNELSRGMLKQRWIKEFGIEQFFCKRCGHNKTYNLVLHHIKYVINGGDNSPENLEPLCLNCHGIEHYENGTDNKE